MPERDRSRTNQFFRELTSSVAKGTVAGVALGVGGLVGTTLLSHRERTHESAKLHPFLVALFELEQRTYGMDNTIWASVHRIHHHVPDATLYPFIRISRAVKQEKMRDVPRFFPHLDRFVEYFPLDEVMAISEHGEKLVTDRFGDEYKPPKYSDAEIRAIFYPTSPQYYYPDFPHLEKEYSQEDQVRILTTDPHSPSLVPLPNGVKGVFKRNVALYGRPSNVFKAHPNLKPKDLQRDDDEAFKNYKPYIVGSFLAMSAAAYFLRGEHDLKNLVLAAVVGSTANGVRMYAGAALGGKVTNAFGHMGEVTTKDFIEAMFKKEYQIRLNPDGTVSTNTVNAGFLGKLSSYLTADEVGGQDAHHKYPEKIAYTEKEGLAAILDAPYGSFTSFLAQSGVPFITEGDQFDEIDKELRPDMPNPAMDIIHSARVADMQKAA